jgi:hypothetical protein
MQQSQILGKYHRGAIRYIRFCPDTVITSDIAVATFIEIP